MDLAAVPAVPAAHPPAHPGARGRRRPDHPAGQRQILAALIPSARLHVYSGGHAELVARPGLLAPLVSDFLARGSLRESSSVQR
jgi:hypothetical protein